MRFFKSTGYFLNRLGTAAGIVTGSVIGVGVSIFGTALNFTAEDLEVLADDIIPGRKRLNTLLERQLDSNGIAIEDCRNDLRWSPCLKRADALLRRGISVFCAIVDAALGTVAGISYLAANTPKDEGTKSESDLSYSVLAGACIGLQCFTHYFAMRQISSIHQEAILLRSQLASLEEDRSFLSWKLEILQRNNSTTRNRLKDLVTEQRVLTETHLSHQAESQQKEEQLRQLVETENRIENDLQNAATVLRVNRSQLNRLANQPESVDARVQLQSETNNLERTQKNKKAELEELKTTKETMREEHAELKKMITKDTATIENKKAEIAVIEQQCIKLAERIEGLQRNLKPEEQTRVLRVTPS